MEYDVSTLSQLTAVSVDTIRYYQSRGLLHAPTRQGRRAVYGESHRERLERIRAMAARGFSLKAIEAALAAGDCADGDTALLAAVESESAAGRYSSEELAERLGIPHGLLVSVEKAGVVEAELGEDRGSRYSESDLRMARAALGLLRRGLPLTKLLSLAIRHDRGVRKSVDAAIDLFDDHIRKSSDGDRADDPEAVAEAFRELLPVVTMLVAHHFQRVLVNRAIKRLRRSGHKRALREALRATRVARGSWRWT